MQLIGAALGDQHHLSARRPAFVGALASHGNPKLLHGIQWNRQHGIEAGDPRLAALEELEPCVDPTSVCAADTGVLVVVYVHTVEDDVVLIAARPHHFTVDVTPGCRLSN